MELSELIAAELEINSGKLEKRGFPTVGKGAKYYRELKIGEFGEIDALGVCWDKRLEMLSARLYKIYDGGVGSKDIVLLTMQMGAVATWLHKKKEIDLGVMNVTGALIGSSIDDDGLLSLHMGGNISFYTSVFNLYNGIEFDCADTYVFDSIDMDIAVELPEGF